jgi:hypothetical protein
VIDDAVVLTTCTLAGALRPVALLVATGSDDVGVTSSDVWTCSWDEVCPTACGEACACGGGVAAERAERAKTAVKSNTSSTRGLITGISSFGGEVPTAIGEG